MTVLVAAVLAGAIVLPHALRLERATPSLAAALWLAALALRALTAVFVALVVVVVIPSTELFSLVTHWCWHTVMPVVATHLGLDGHRVGDAALVLPAAILAVSALSVVVGLWKGTRTVARLIQRASVGRGPQDSVIVGDGDVVVAAAGMRRPLVVVSAGALASFDDEELAASLEHENGHIARRHRYVLVIAELCRALARFIPGTRQAVRELRFHLERDADRFALERQHEPVVLASAICKAAQGRSTAVMTALAGGGVTRRIRALLDGAATSQPVNGLAVRTAVALLVALVLALGAALPSVTVAAMQRTDAGVPVRHCIDS